MAMGTLPYVVAIRAIYHIWLLSVIIGRLERDTRTLPAVTRGIRQLRVDGTVAIFAHVKLFLVVTPRAEGHMLTVTA